MSTRQRHRFLLLRGFMDIEPPAIMATKNALAA